MTVNHVISHNQNAWQEVSVTWNDEQSVQFHKVLMEMEGILNNLNRSCENLENDTRNTVSTLNRLESM